MLSPRWVVLELGSESPLLSRSHLRIWDGISPCYDSNFSCPFPLLNPAVRMCSCLSLERRNVEPAMAARPPSKPSSKAAASCLLMEFKVLLRKKLPGSLYMPHGMARGCRGHGAALSGPSPPRMWQVPEAARGSPGQLVWLPEALWTRWRSLHSCLSVICSLGRCVKLTSCKS